MGVMQAYYESEPAKAAVKERREDATVYLLRDQIEQRQTADVDETEYIGPRQSEVLWYAQEVEVETTKDVTLEDILANFDAYWAAGDRESESDFTRLLELEEKMDAVIELLLGSE